MHSLPFTEARAHLADTLREVEATGTPVLISRRGQTAGVLMSWAQYRRLQSGTAGFSARLTQVAYRVSGAGGGRWAGGGDRSVR